jgi:hypothetical protein
MHNKEPEEPSPWLSLSFGSYFEKQQEAYSVRTYANWTGIISHNIWISSMCRKTGWE